MQTFNRSKIVERMVHACGSGAFGEFTVTSKDAAALSKAAFLQPGTRTPVFATVVIVVIGVILFILGSAGREIGGRRHWY